MEEGRSEKEKLLDSDTAIIFMDTLRYHGMLYSINLEEEWFWHVTGRILTGTINAPFRSTSLLTKGHLFGTTYSVP